jgi:hypothetical protein
MEQTSCHFANRRIFEVKTWMSTAIKSHCHVATLGWLVIFIYIMCRETMNRESTGRGLNLHSRYDIRVVTN